MAKRTGTVFGEKVKIKRCKLKGKYGDFNKDTFEIRIDSRLNKELYERTLLHELGHALTFRLGLEQSIPEGVLEILVEGYANFLYESDLLEISFN